MVLEAQQCFPCGVSQNTMKKHFENIPNGFAGRERLVHENSRIHDCFNRTEIASQEYLLVDRFANMSLLDSLIEKSGKNLDDSFPPERFYSGPQLWRLLLKILEEGLADFAADLGEEDQNLVKLDDERGFALLNCG